MDILITGANGLLGQHLVRQLLEQKHKVIATGKGPSRLTVGDAKDYSYYELDITDGPAVNDMLLRLKPAVVIHAAAMTQVDHCELHKIDCWNVNVTATRFIVDAANEINAWIILLSTDFVFDGLHAPYAEDSETGPVNYYGSSKLAAEKAVIELAREWTIVRTALVFSCSSGDNRPNIVKWAADKLRQGEKLQVVHDQFRTPTYVVDLAAGICQVVAKKSRGIFHISGKDIRTPYEVVHETASILGIQNAEIKKVSTAELSQTAVRPANTVFNISKAQNQLGYSPRSFTEALAEMFNQNERFS